MNKNTYNNILIFLISLSLAAIGIGLVKLDPYGEDAQKIVAFILIPLWMFSIIPAYIVLIKWMKTKTFHEGLWLGLIFKELIFIGPILIAPFFMIKYYIDMIKEKIKENKHRY